jgi:hypothetical protein
VWAALSAFAPGRSEPEAEEETQADHCGDKKRARRNTLQEGYVNTGHIQVGSSSPIQDQASQGSSSVGFVDHDLHRATAPVEDRTVRLANCVLRHILLYASPQDSDSPAYVVEIRHEKLRLCGITPLHRRKIIAIDDGGLYLRDNNTDSVRITRPHVAIMEAKSRFRDIEDGRPVTSDSCLAQMTCQALATRLLDRDEDPNEKWGCSFESYVMDITLTCSLCSIIILHFTQHYVCLLQFDISDEYLENFEDDQPSSFIYVSSTPWFDLQTSRGRENLVKSLSRLMVWASKV